MAQIQIGNTSFNTEAFKNITKEEFIVMYKGKLTIDLNEAWEQIDKHLVRYRAIEEFKVVLSNNNEANEQDTRTSKKHKKTKY